MRLKIILDEVLLLNGYYSYEGLNSLQHKRRKYGAVDRDDERTYGQRVRCQMYVSWAELVCYIVCTDQQHENPSEYFEQTCNKSSKAKSKSSVFKSKSSINKQVQVQVHILCLQVQVQVRVDRTLT